MIRTLKRLFVYVVLTAVTFAGFTQAVQAAMIGTDQIHSAAAGDASRARIEAALSRPDVMSQLEKFGVARADAQARVASMTDAEANQLASHMDTMPAGGDGVLGAIVFVFVLLIVTDLLGLTKVFPFTRAQR